MKPDVGWLNEKLTHEIALLKRFKFAKRSKQLSPDQACLLEDLIDTDIAVIEAELEALQPASVVAKVRRQPSYALSSQGVFASRLQLSGYLALTARLSFSTFPRLHLPMLYIHSQGRL